MRPQAHSINYLADGLTILVPIILIGVSLIWFELKITLTLVLLVGVWVVDGYLKKSHGFTTETLFADLSFASFISVGSQTVTMIAKSASPATTSSSVIELGVIAFILGLMWLGNLTMCRGLSPSLQASQPQRQRASIWVASIAFGVISTSVALIPQVIGLL